MVRVFHIYYPVRQLLLLGCEAAIVCASFLIATFLRFGPDTYIVLNFEHGLYKIFIVTAMALVASHYFDLYAPQRLGSSSETYFRLLIVLGLLSFSLAALTYLFPSFMVGDDVFIFGLVILTVALLLWRIAYNWLLNQSYLREHVCVVGSAEGATRLVQAIRNRPDLGMEVVRWVGGADSGTLTRESIAEQLNDLAATTPVARVIVAMTDRRGTMPVHELLNLRLRGVKIEEAGSLLEKVEGKIQLDDLHPSSMIFAEGFRVNYLFQLTRRIISFCIAAVSLLLCLPLIPIITLAVKLSSPGPIFFQQQRVGKGGKTFNLYKFRTMRQDAEAQTGAVWAGKDDPRTTRVGRFLRKVRLDELPQLWNVIKGEMGFVGPRPERPEFVQWLATKIPYYHLRHIVRPGVTGWAQVRYRYGASLEETSQKLQYDLYYIKHMSLSLDLLIMFETIKTIVLQRGAQ